MSDSPVRIVLQANGATTKFLNLFVGKDESLYIHMYRPTGQPWMAPPASLVNIPGGKLQPIEFGRFTPSDFQHNKVTFHPSGYIHLTDTAGKRLRDGVRGPRFSDIALPYDFATFAPCEPALLPPITKGRYLDLVFDLLTPIQPLYVTLSMVDPEAPSPSAPASIFGEPSLVSFQHSRFLIAFTFWNVKAMDPTPVPWPPFPFHLLRITA
jgi:hypothetical protein